MRILYRVALVRKQVAVFRIEHEQETKEKNQGALPNLGQISWLNARRARDPTPPAIDEFWKNLIENQP